jgi:hypothetical protein
LPTEIAYLSEVASGGGMMEISKHILNVFTKNYTLFA